MTIANEQKIARFLLPANGKNLWTAIMQGEQNPSGSIDSGSALVAGFAEFDDGVMVAGGVLKSTDPTEYNTLYMWVFDKNGNRVDGWPIDVSDYEDFHLDEIGFSISADYEETHGTEEYLIKIVEG